MQTSHVVKAGILACILVVSGLTGWELYLRGKGLSVDYDDGESLWADKRAMVYEPPATSTVFIGSSRIKFDLDIATWEALSGNHAIQLSIEGSSPRPMLTDLANDTSFKDRLVVDVTEGLFFSNSPFGDEKPLKNIAYYKKRTPAQQFSFRVNHVLESKLVFLDQDNFSFSAMLDQLRIPNRRGVMTMPLFPVAASRVSFDRQDSFTQRFLTDSIMKDSIMHIWKFYGGLAAGPPVSGNELQAILNAVKSDVDKIKARGGQVVFVRTPSSGFYLAGENKGFPRAAYWDRLLSVTGCPGIHFADYPPIAHFICPESSHLTPADAVLYTKQLVQLLPHSFSNTH